MHDMTYRLYFYDEQSLLLALNSKRFNENDAEVIYPDHVRVMPVTR